MRRSNISGFTLLEMITTLAVVAVIGAIATPSWLSFINQRRVNQVNQQLYQALLDIQTRAKKESIGYTLELQNNPDTQTPQIAIYLTGGTVNNWSDLGDSSKQTELVLTDGSKVAFDYQGRIDNDSEIQPLERIRVVSKDNPNGPVRCVIFKSVLGFISTGINNQCQ